MRSAALPAVLLMAAASPAAAQELVVGIFGGSVQTAAELRAAGGRAELDVTHSSCSA